MTKDHYLRNKLALDPHVELSEEHPDSNLVIWRDSDVMSKHEHAQVLDGGFGSPVPAGETCGHDKHRFNTDPMQNHAIRKPASVPLTSWYDPLGFSTLSNHTKRDDVAGPGMGMEYVPCLRALHAWQGSNVVTASQVLLGPMQGAPRHSESSIWVLLQTASTQNDMDLRRTPRRLSSQTGTLQAHYTRFVVWNVAVTNSITYAIQSTFQVSLGIIELEVRPPTSVSIHRLCRTLALICFEQMSFFYTLRLSVERRLPRVDHAERSSLHLLRMARHQG